MMFYLMVLITILSLNGLGIFSNIYLFSTPIGNITLNLLVFIILIFSVFLKLTPKNKVNIFNKILKPYTYMVILLLIWLFINIFIEHASILSISINFRTINMIFFLYILIAYIRTKKQYVRYFNILIYSAVIMSIVTIIQAITGVKTPGSPNIPAFGRIYRVWHYGLWLVGMMTIFLFIKLLYKYKTIDLSYFLINFIAVFASLSRGLIISVILGLVLSLFIKNRKAINISTLIRTFYIFFIIVGLFLFTSFFTDFKFSNLTKRITEGNQKINTGGDKRLNMAYEKSVFLIEHDFFGKGLNHKAVINRGGEKDPNWDYFDPYYLNGDFTYQNILLVYGVPGLLIFLFMFYNNYHISYRIFKQSISIDTKIYALFFTVLPISVFLFGINGSLHSYQGYTIISIMVGLTYLLKRFYEE